MVDYTALTWEELIDFNKFTSHKKKPVIIVELEDNLFKRYNAVVVKYDNNKNVHVRYLDNPYYKDSYWWTSNKDNLPGLDPSAYHAICLGDSYDEMEGLVVKDFVEGGYDDIINFDKEPHRFFKPIKEYPYLNGKQGNIHVNSHYITELNKELENKIVPNVFKLKYGLKNRIRLHNLTENYHDIYLIAILERFKSERNILYYIQSLLYNYGKYRDEPEQIKKILIDLKKLLSLRLTNNFIYKTCLNDKNRTEDQLRMIKDSLKRNENITEMIYILEKLLNINFTIFEYNSGENDMNIIKSENPKIDSIKIYLLKYNNFLEVLI